MARDYILKSDRPSSLDLQQHNRNNFCGRWSVKGQVQDEGQGRWHYARLGCKRWPCPRCGPKKARRLRHAIIEKAVEKDLRRFLTLTLDPSTCTPEQSIAYIRQCWNKYRTYLKRKFGVAVSYIAILELQKSGYAHLHILVDRYIDQRWISETWRAVGGGKIVFITQVDIHRIAAYLSKYLTKELLLAGFRPRQRRYTTSRDIILFVKQPSGTWALSKMSVEFLYLKARREVLEEVRDEGGTLRWFTTREEVDIGLVRGLFSQGAPNSRHSTATNFVRQIPER